MTLSACLHALMARAVPHALVEAICIYINTKVIACLDVYQAAPMTRRTLEHACFVDRTSERETRGFDGISDTCSMQSFKKTSMFSSKLTIPRLVI